MRVIRYDGDTGELFGEIINYDYKAGDSAPDIQPSLYFAGVEKIKFRSLDTGGFLASVILQKSNPQRVVQGKAAAAPPAEYVVMKAMKVPFSKVNFLFGSVSFTLFIDELNGEMQFQIDNADIRPEFDAIREYFVRALRKKMITVEITIRYTAEAILSSSARSDDIAAINDKLIDSVRFQFVKRRIFGPGNSALIDTVSTFDSLLEQADPATRQLFSNERALFDGILDTRKCRHYQQLKFLASRHESLILKLRFVLQPFSFLFLLAGEKKYHIVWETLDTEEATYVWTSDKSGESLRQTLDQIEAIITGIRKDGRQDYLRQEHPNFSRIWHDYSEPKKGFVVWKGTLEERLV